MAEQKKRARASTAAKKAVQKPTGASSTRQRKPVVTKESKAAAAQVLAGFEMLRKAAVDELSEGGEKIAKKLRLKSEQGDTKSTKLLIELAMKPKQAKGPTLESVALKIAADPEWVETADSATAGKTEHKQSHTDRGTGK